MALPRRTGSRNADCMDTTELAGAERGEQQRSPGRAPVVVGVDGSDESIAALRSARRLANMLDAPLEILWGWQLPPLAYAGYPAVVDWSPSDDARRALDRLVGEEFGAEPPEWLRASVMAGSPAKILLDASQHARLLVVGGRGHGGFTGLLLGSVSEACARHAQCSVLVVRRGRSFDDIAEDATGYGETERPIVVGVDGSAESVAALLIAEDLASRTDCGLNVILVWRGPRFFTGGLGPELPWSPADDAEDALKRCLADAFGSEIPTRVEASTYQGRPAEVLISNSEDARLLVVGSRGHGGFTGLLLGSVAEASVRHSASNVLVVHGDAERLTKGSMVP